MVVVREEEGAPVLEGGNSLRLLGYKVEHFLQGENGRFLLLLLLLLLMRHVIIDIWKWW